MKGVWILSLLLPYSAAKCLNDCSQHGLCSGPGTDAFCICEAGYGKEDCSEQFCPKGDDPITIAQNYRQITISTGSASGHLGGHFDFTFMGQTIGFDATATALSMKYAFEALPSVQEVEVRRGGTTSDGGATYTITFLAWPKGIPVDNNLYEHDGFPPLSFFKCTTEGISGVSKPFCEVKDYGEVNPKNVIEYVMCSNHGTCDRSNGQCKCDKGWSGDACDDNADDDDHTLMYAEGPFFSGAIARLAVHKNPAKDFDFIKVSASDGRQEIMTLDGSGDMFLNKGNFDVEEGDVTLKAGNLNLNRGNIDVKHGSMDVLASSVGGGVSIRLDSAPLDNELKQLGLGSSLNPDEMIGVEYDYKSLLTVSAPMITMANLLASDAYGGFDYITVGPQPDEGAEATLQGMSVRRTNAFFRVDHTGMCIMTGNRKMRSQMTTSDIEDDEADNEAGGDENHWKGGGLLIQNGNLRVIEGNAMFDGNVHTEHALSVNGTDGVSVNNGPFIVRSGNALIRSPIKSQPALKIEASSSSSSSSSNDRGNFQSSLLHLNIPTSLIQQQQQTQQHKSSFIRASLQHDKDSRTYSPHTEVGNPKSIVGEMNGDGEEVIFDVSHEGHISTSGGIQVNSGGIHVETGGMNINNGGLNIHGGLSLHSGSLNMNTAEGFKVNQGGLLSVSNSSSNAAITATVNADHFLGTVMKLESSANPNEVDFDYLLASPSGSSEVLASISGKGTITGQMLEAKGNVEVHKNLIIGGHAVFGDGGSDQDHDGDGGDGSSHSSYSSSSVLSAGDLIIIPPCGVSSTSSAKSSSFLKISSDGHVKQNKLLLPIKGNNNCEPLEGQLLLIYNGDEEITTGDAAIPTGRTVLFIFSKTAGPPSWIPLTTLDARGSKLDKITSFTALNDLDIGDYSFKAKQLISAGQIKSQISYYGAGGLLTGDPSFTFNNGLLTTKKINIKQVDSNGVDFMGTPLTNVRVESGSIQGISVLRTQQIFVESLQPLGTLLMAGANGGIASCKSVFVSELEKGGVSGADVVSTLVTPSLRVTDLSSGDLVSVGVHGELNTWTKDLKLNFINNVNPITGEGAPISVQRAAELKLQGSESTITAELQATRLQTSTLLGTVPTQAQLNAIAAQTARQTTNGANGGNGVTGHSGKPEIRVFGDLVMDGYELRGAAIVGSSLRGVEELGVTTLTMKQQRESSLAYFAANSTLQSFPGSSIENGVLKFDQLKIGKLENDLDCNGYNINHAKLTSGTLENMLSVSTNELKLNKLASPHQLSNSIKKDVLTFALLDSDGQIHSPTSSTHSKGDGAVSGYSDFSYDISKQTLHVSNIGEHSLSGNINGNDYIMNNIILEKTDIKNAINIHSDGNMNCENDLDVGGDASITGTLVVGGTVMGSGPYVDSSDVRFKMNIQDLYSKHKNEQDEIKEESEQKEEFKEKNEADTGLSIVKQLRPVSYYFNHSSHEKKKFPKGEEIGLIAQEVEQIIPQIVSTDEEGYKGVAYSRLTPVLISAVQELSNELNILKEENKQLQSKILSLEKEINTKSDSDSDSLLAVMMAKIIALEEKLNQ